MSILDNSKFLEVVHVTMHQKKLFEKAKVCEKNNRMKESSKNSLTDRCLKVDKGPQHQVDRGRL